MLLLHVIDGCSQHPGLHRYALPLDANHVDRLTPILRDGDNLDVVLLPDFLYILEAPVSEYDDDSGSEEDLGPQM